MHQQSLTQQNDYDINQPSISDEGKNLDPLLVCTPRLISPDETPLPLIIEEHVTN